MVLICGDIRAPTTQYKKMMRKGWKQWRWWRLREHSGRRGGDESSHESRGKESRGCTHSEVSAGLRIKTRGEFESGKVLNDFRRSCFASWFIRKSQFAQRAERTSEIDVERERRKERARKSRRREGEREERCFSNEEKEKRVRERKRERERERLDYQYRSEKSYKITTLHFSFRVTPTPGRVQRSRRRRWPGMLLTLRETFHDRVDAEKFKAPRAAKRDVQSSTRRKFLIETVVL